MLKVIEAKAEITRLQERFQKRLSLQPDARKVAGRIIYRPWHEDVVVHWLPTLGIWTYSRPSKNRFWNAFGVIEPKPGSRIRIACEINIPFQGIHRSIGGLFCREDGGGVFVAHRGRMGGGAKGVTKDRVLSWFRDQIEDVSDDAETAPAIMIGALDDATFGKQLAAFVRNCAALRETPSSVPATRAGKDGRLRQPFSPEFSAEKTYDVASRIVAKCKHGVVVNALAAQLRGRGLLVSNSQHQDLLVTARKHGSPHALFEVKSDASLSSIYCAIGQLFYHSRAHRKPPSLIAVLPERANGKISERLSTLGIHVLSFSDQQEAMTFPGLSRILRLAAS